MLFGTNESSGDGPSKRSSIGASVRVPGASVGSRGRYERASTLPTTSGGIAAAYGAKAESDEPIKHDAKLYTRPPISPCVSIREFEEAALSRLRVLVAVDRAHLMETDEADAGGGGLSYIEREKAKDSKCLKAWENENFFFSGSPVASVNRLRVREKDDISHFSLRLAFCTQREHQEFFVQQEARLLRAKLNELTASELHAFLERENILFDWIDLNGDTPSDLPRLFVDDLKRFHGPSVRVFYKVPFAAAANSVGRRRVCLHKGIAYIPQQDLSGIIVSRFRVFLFSTLQVVDSSPLLLRIHSDPRIGAFLKNLSRAYVGSDVKAFTPGIDGEVQEGVVRLSPGTNVDALAQRSFPPCMRRLYEAVKKEKHLKHWGRLQLWLYFKGCGMTMEEQLAYWKGQMTLKAASFEKEHAYTIRHIFGKAGAMKSKAPYSCVKLIAGDTPPYPATGDYHGCPFKTFDPNNLANLLRAYKCPDPNLRTILDLVRNNHHQLGCVEFFKAMHPGASSESVGNHPNAFYAESCKFYAQRGKENAGQSTEASQEMKDTTQPDRNMEDHGMTKMPA